MLDDTLPGRIRPALNDAPSLNPWFESSVPGLFFVGNAAAMSFGPLMHGSCTATRSPHGDWPAG